MDDDSLINHDTLELAYTESKLANERFFTEVDAFNQKADQQAQITLILIGVFFTVGGSLIANASLFWLLPFIFISLVMLSVSASMTLFGKLRGDFYSGTLYPHVMAEQLDVPPDDLKWQLLQAVSESYYFNVPVLARKSRTVGRAGMLQVSAIIVPIVAIVIVTVQTLVTGG